MGEAFNASGHKIGEAVGDTREQVLKELTERHGDTMTEVRIRTGRKESPIERIQNTFMYHKPFGSQTTRYETLRVMAKNLAYNIEQLCPDSREKSLALTNLQQAIMWANASIAINEKDPNPTAVDEQESPVADGS